MTARWIFRIAMLALSMAGFGIATENAGAQNYPNKPITYIAPFAPGTGNDVIARIVAQKLTESWPSAVVVANVVGASGGVALERTAKASPDGYTIVIASTSQIITPLVSKVRYDIEKDFAPVSLSGSLPYVLAVGNSVPAKSIEDLVALAQSKPGKVNFSAGMVGGVPHLLGEMLKSAGKIDIVAVPYKSTTDAETDVISGRVEIWFTTMASALPQSKAGKVRVLGVAGDKRAATLPDVPTMAEAGFPTLDVSVSFFVLAPAGTPKPVIAALNGEIVKAIAAKDVRDRFANAGVEPSSSTPEELGALLKSEVARWGKIIKESGIRLN